MNQKWYKTYLFDCFEVQVAEFQNVDGLVSQDLPRVVLEHVIEVLGESVPFSVLASHFICLFEYL